jgi:glycyl-tRNA synthetase
MSELTMDKLVALCKNRGIVYPGSEIYGGLANAWDYGPVGAEMKNNIKQAWWKKFVRQSPYNVGLDSAILMNPQVWVASGHVGGFSDPLMDCRACKARFRADQLIEDYARQNGLAIKVDGMDAATMEALIEEKQIPCPACGKHAFTGIRKFNLMFKTFMGVTEDSASEVYLRPETAQGIFVNFKNVLRTSRKKLPFGIAQIGKAFRNEITPGNFIFRTREFEQMELEFFCAPGEDLKWFAYWKDYCVKFLTDIGIRRESIVLRDHDKEELSHYSNATTDIEFLYPFGQKELWGIADRTDFDLKAHSKESGQTLEYMDPTTGERVVPYCIEPSVGVDRLLLAILCDAYEEQDLGDDTRVVLHLHPIIAPFKAAVLPLQKKFADKAEEIFASLSSDFMIDYDESGSIGRRYRRQDEIGTPFCITIDGQTMEDDTVTIRDRDSMVQIRLHKGELHGWMIDKLSF